MERFTYPATYGTALESDQRVLRSQFGDGYEQRAPDGINAKRNSWALSFKNVTKTRADEISAFLASVGSITAFIWTPPPPHDTPQTFTAVLPFKETYEGHDNRSIEVVFRQDHNPAARCETPSVTAGVSNITITTATAGALIRWTNDGTTPTETSGTLYAAPFAKESGKTYRAIAYRTDLLPSQIGTVTT